MRTLILAALMLVPKGGTVVRIPMEETSADRAKKLVELVKALEYEVYECACGKEASGNTWRYGACSACGKETKASATKIRLNAWVEDGALEVASGGQFAALHVVRLSALEKQIKDVGLKTRREGWLAGPFAIHVEKMGDAKILAEQLGKLDGVHDASASGSIVYVNQSREENRVNYAAIEKLAKERGLSIEDISWVINRCYGRIGFVSE